MMKIEETGIEGVFILHPRIFHDKRGYFMETFSSRWFKENVADIEFVQDNESFSSYGVIRGLHFQKPPFSQAKLVRCTKGSVLDVAVDLRKGSKTYGKYVAIELSEENKKQFFIPQGFAHGFAVLSHEATFQYKCSQYYHPEAEGGIALESETLNIDWRIPEKDRILSDKDRKHQSIEEFQSPF